jgi:multidrug efflux pump subunit AcrA (membrane-fusion protein)
MKLTHYFLLPLISAGLLVAGCSKDAGDEKAKSSAENKSRVKHGTNGSAILTLDEATQKSMGLQTAALQSATLAPEVKGYGHVLDVSPLASLVADITTAQAANDASQAELKRLKALMGQNNASERALQAAEATAAHDQAQLAATRLKLVSSWGTAVARRDDLPALAQGLSALSNVLVEIDLPAGTKLSAAPTGGRLLALGDGAEPIDAQLLGPAPVVDPQLQGRGFLFLVTSNSSHLAPGAAVSGLLTFPGEPQSGVTVPRDAVIRFNGTAWVYLQTGDETFERTEVPVDRPTQQGWFVAGRLKPESKVVTVGAQQMLSEELKGANEGE